MSDDLTIGKMRAIELRLGSVMLRDHPGNISYEYYRANEVHQLLGEGQEYFWTPHGDAGMIQKPEHTHRALGIGVRPIIQESEERKLLREIVNTLGYSEYALVIKKAKALLEAKPDEEKKYREFGI